METIKIIEQIFAAFGTLGWIELFGAFVVAIGCAGELWILVNKLTRRIEPMGKTASKFWRYLAWLDIKIRPLLLLLKINGRKISEPKEQLLERLFVLLVACGVTIEFICLPFSMSEIASLNDEAGKARQEAGQSNERAAIAEKAAGKANESAAKLTELANGLELTNAQFVADNLVLRSNVAMLELAAQWRTVTHEQEQIVTNFLNPKQPSLNTNSEVRIQASMTDAEACWYADELARVLAESKFKVSEGMDASVFHGSDGGPFVGVALVVKSLKSDGVNFSVHGNAAAIYAAFTLAKIPLTSVQQDTNPPIDDSVSILIGHKPQN